MTSRTHRIEERITEFLRADLKIPADEIDPYVNLGTYGLSSVAAVKLIGIIEDDFSLKLSPTLVFDYPTISSLANAIDASDQSGESNRRSA